MADSRKSKLFKTFLSRMNTLKKDKYAAELFADLEAGKNSYMRIDRLESSNFDMTWINRIEDCIYELGEIIANPKQVTKTVTGLVPVELARKTGAESVQHLSSHTQYIKEITDKGDVVPNKILNIGSEEDIHTYENRFIATLIRRLVLFIEKRYEIIKKFSTLHDEEILYYKTKAIVDGSEVEIETKIKVKSESDSENANMSNNYVTRIVKLREYILYFYGSKFMKELKTERDVRNPIMMTNIIRKNPKYHKCYELFRFIEKYDKLGVAYKLDEDTSMFSEEELNELNTVMFTNYLALKAKDRSKVTKGFSRKYNPRILTSLDDEQFIYGDLLRGPIEFLRVDEGYQQYLDEQLKQDIPARPTKIEKEYYAEEIAARNARKAEKAALDKLEKRKKKEQADYEKQVRAIVAQREKEEAERLAKEAEASRKEEERKIEEVRQALVRDALFGSDTNPEAEIGDSDELEVAQQDVLTSLNEEQPETVEEVSEEASEVVEEPVQEEQPQEEINEEQAEEAPTEEQSEAIEEASEQVEEPVSEVDEEEPQEVEEVQEEQPKVVEEPVQEEVEETQEEQPEVEETPTEPVQDSQTEQANESDLDAIRQQLMADALNDELSNEEGDTVVDEVVANEQPEAIEEPLEEVSQEDVETISEEQTEVIEEVSTDDNNNEQPVIVVPSSEEVPQKEVESLENEEPVEINNEEPIKTGKKSKKQFVIPPSSSDRPHQPRFVKVGNRRGKGNNEENPSEEDNQVNESNNGSNRPSYLVPPTDRPHQPRFVKVGNKRHKKESEEEKPEEVNNNSHKPFNLTPPTDRPHQPRFVKVGNKRHKKEVEEEVEEEVNEEMEIIPGKFIVKTNEGYYVGPDNYSNNKNDAFIFDDFNQANEIKKSRGGKVIKL